MPSADVYKRLLTGVRVADMLAHNSNRDMEMTWDEDIQSKRCYIYDYYHDDQPHLAEGMSYDETTKTPIDAKFIVTQYGSLSKDQVEFHIMFRPSQSIEFGEYDDLYYYETDYRLRYGASFPIGLYIDIPDERGKYHKWLICDKEYGNQFIKYSVLPCEYYAMWIENDGDKRIKRKMWCVPRSQNSYNAGVWRRNNFEILENQTLLWFPINPITEQFNYTYQHDPTANQRLIFSTFTQRPAVWRITKINNANPFGIIKITLYQDSWNDDTDYVNLETKEMFADYYRSSVEPIKDTDTTIVPKHNRCEISATNNIIKIGGSYKLLTVRFYDGDNNEITSDYINYIDVNNWDFYINGSSASNLITIKSTSENNQLRIKFADDKSYLTKVLTVKFKIAGDGGLIQTELPLEISAI